MEHKRNPILANILPKHGGQFTTEASNPPTVHELDTVLRQKAMRSPILANILAKHGGQFTTEALYEAAIELERWSSALANLAIQQASYAPMKMPPLLEIERFTQPTDPPDPNHPTFRL